MNEPFMIPVFYQGTEHEFKARFERWGYTHRFAVLVDDTTYTFEPDEEGSYRALTTGPIPGAETGLLQQIADTLARLH